MPERNSLLPTSVRVELAQHHGDLSLPVHAAVQSWGCKKGDALGWDRVWAAKSKAISSGHASCRLQKYGSLGIPREKIAVCMLCPLPFPE